MNFAEEGVGHHRVLADETIVCLLRPKQRLELQPVQSGLVGDPLVVPQDAGTRLVLSLNFPSCIVPIWWIHPEALL
jgi:hypothetical protein